MVKRDFLWFLFYINLFFFIGRSGLIGRYYGLGGYLVSTLSIIFLLTFIIAFIYERKKANQKPSFVRFLFHFVCWNIILIVWQVIVTTAAVLPPIDTIDLVSYVIHAFVTGVLLLILTIYELFIRNKNNL